MHLPIHISAATVGTIPAMKQDSRSWSDKHRTLEYKQEMFSGINDKRILVLRHRSKVIYERKFNTKLTQAWWYLDEILLFRLGN